MRLADPKPPFCAACFQHSTDTHVDFEASYDGPVIEKDGIKTPVDDLILCESCVRSAANLLGMLDPEMLLKLIQDAEGEIRELRNEVEKKDKVISDLTYTNGALAEFPVKRRQGRPHFKGVPQEVKDELKTRVKRSEAQKKRYAEAAAKE